MKSACIGPVEVVCFDKLSTNGVECLNNFIGVQPLAFLQGQHVELGRVVEQAAVVGACFH